jgi:hypothetical protein
VRAAFRLHRLAVRLLEGLSAWALARAGALSGRAARLNLRLIEERKKRL